MDGLQPLGTLLGSELNLLALAQRAEPRSLDGRLVDKHVIPGIAGDEVISFAVVEPLDGSSPSFGRLMLLLHFVKLCDLRAKQRGRKQKARLASASLGGLQYTAKTYFVLLCVVYHTCLKKSNCKSCVIQSYSTVKVSTALRMAAATTAGQRPRPRPIVGGVDVEE